MNCEVRTFCRGARVLIVNLAILLLGTANQVWAAEDAASWGGNRRGQLGNSSITNQSSPVSVTTTGALSGKSIKSLSAGNLFSLAVTTDGRVYGWGDNSFGQLGNSGTANSSSAVAVKMSGALLGKSVTAVAAGARHSLALAADGKVFAWGANGNGQLGNNTETPSLEPAAVKMDGALAGKTAIAIAAGDDFSMVLTSDGRVFGWGSNENGQLGNGSNLSSLVAVPVAVNGVLAGKTISQISAGGSHCLARTSDGLVVSWGSNRSGQLGDGTNEDRNAPIIVANNSALRKPVALVAAGGSHSLAVSETGILAAWGGNNSGQLGDGTNTQRRSPVLPSATSPLYSLRIRTVAAGYSHSLAYGSDGKLYSWGNGTTGELGNGATSSSNVAVQVNTAGVLAGKVFGSVAAGADHSLVIGIDPVPQSGSDQLIFRYSSELYDQVGTFYDGPLDSGSEATFRLVSSVPARFIGVLSDGTALNPETTDPAVRYREAQVPGRHIYIYSVFKPAVGPFQIGSHLPSGSPDGMGEISVTIKNELRLQANSGKANYPAGSPAFIRAVLTEEANALAGAQINASGGSDASYFNIALYDDGAHGDGAAGDGVYAGFTPPLAMAGSYETRISAIGANAAGQAFTRQSFLSFTVGDQIAPNVTVTTPANGSAVK